MKAQGNPVNNPVLFSVFILSVVTCTASAQSGPPSSGYIYTYADKTYAGNGTCSASGDRGPATNARLCAPSGVAFNAAGNLFFADGDNESIRRVDALTGIITTGAGDWTWANGSNTVVPFCPSGKAVCGLTGVYGTLGVFAAGNFPGGRSDAASWTDNSGNLWLFGGNGVTFPYAMEDAVLNDLWEFNPSTNQWAWDGGSNQVGSNSGTGNPRGTSGLGAGYGWPGVYGTQGQANTGNIPGSRFAAATWTDSSGNLWLFGGSGLDANNTWGLENDLWEFNLSTRQWAWMGGSSTVGSNCASSDTCGLPGVYGVLGVPAVGNIPGGRLYATHWTDQRGNLWLFGGQGIDSAGDWGLLNDLWEFNPSANEWAWMGGSNTLGGNSGRNWTGRAGVYGTLGIPVQSNIPGGRNSAVGWIDTGGNLWLFGGNGFDAGGVSTILNDLWEYNTFTNEWTWAGGSSSGDQNGVYGVEGMFAAANIPGARVEASSWTEKNGSFWLFGGDGLDSAPADDGGPLNDLWMYDTFTMEWAWMGGSTTIGGNCAVAGYYCGWAGVYGTEEIPAAANNPGSRESANAWTDRNGNFWLFGGSGFDGNGASGLLYDLWVYQPALSAPVAATPTFSSPAGNYSTAQTVTISDTTPGAVIYYTTDGTAPTASSSVYSSPIAVLTSETIEAIAVATGYANSSIATATYTFTSPVAATPTFSPTAGTYAAAQTVVTISDTTPGAVIYYTTDGTAPTASSSVYSSPIAVLTSETVEAIATATGYSASVVATAAYVITSPPVCTTPSSLNIAYYTIAESDQDESSLPHGLSTNYVLPSLGAHGLPVYNPAAIVNGGRANRAPHDLLSDGEITWWSPALNNGGPGGTSDVVATGTGVVTLPFTNNAFFPPNGTGPNDHSGFQAAVLSGALYVPAAETVNFTFASDDMAFLYLDGQVACSDGGVHGVTSVPCTTSIISAGDHMLQLFYVDADADAAVLDFSITTSNVCTAPIKAVPAISWATPAAITYGTALSSAQLDATSTVAGSFAYTPSSGTVLPAGMQTLSVTFTPSDTIDYATTTASVQLTVMQAPTVIGLSASATSVPAGTPFTLTANVKSTTSQIPTGTVTFCKNGSVLGTASLANGVATYSLALTSLDGSTMTASYSGDTNFLTAKSNSVAIAAQPATTTNLLTASPNPDPIGGTVTFTSTLSSLNGTPTGDVTFYDGTVSLAVVSLVSGVAQYSTNTLTVGPHNITSVYAGSPLFSASTSNAVVETVPDFSISAAPASRSLYTGEATSYTVTVMPGAGFDLPVALSCSQLPDNTTCAFNPAAIPGANGVSQLVIQTTAPHQVTASVRKDNSPWPKGTGWALSALALILIPVRRRSSRLWRMLPVFILAVLLAVMNGCGAPNDTGGTPPGVYTISVDATFSGYGATLTHSAPITLTVKSLL